MSISPFSLAGKTIFVTGASSGIGRSIAVECSKMGATLVITGRNESKTHETFCLLQGKGHSQVIADLTKTEGLNKIISGINGIDGIVLNAGALKTVPVKHITSEAIQEVFDVNIISSIRLIQGLIKQKKINRGSSVVFISSISTTNVKIGNSLYSASKGAVNSFAKALALELAKQTTRVNVIQPGFIKTNIMYKSGAITDDQFDEHIKAYPLGAGEPLDIAYATVYLLSNASKWATGSVFTIDGGFTLK
jgi:NAD(P)-dependent dehydrogenase (short-subunit alcohol dehydrogenase family)